uniref:Uncharacterized protein n=1 Tax=Trichuris muris TaxID=70415 RepID=A0A5S6QHC8_TRIMR
MTPNGYQKPWLLKNSLISGSKVFLSLRIRKTDVAYLADLHFMFNKIYKQLLTEDLNLIKTKSVISAFMSKLLLFKQRFAMGELCQLRNLIKVKKDGRVSDADVEDILYMAIPDWAINPFTNVEDEEISLQTELLDLQSNAELKPRLERVTSGSGCKNKFQTCILMCGPW